MPKIDESIYRENGFGLGDPKQPLFKGQTRLHFAASRDDSEECARLLGLAGAEPNRPDDFGYAPLHDAAYAGAASAISVLLADPRVERAAITSNGNASTALHLAAEEGGLDAVKLLAAPDCVDLLDSHGRTAFAIAADSEHHDIARHLAPLTNSRSADPKGFTPFLSAARLGSAECMRILLAVSDRHASNTDGANAAWLAARSGNVSALKLAIDEGIDFHMPNRHGATAAMAAATLHEPDCLALLIAHGIDIHARDNNGRTLAIIAADFTRDRCLGLLLEHGVDPLARDHAGHDARHYAGFNTFSACTQALDSFEARLELEASTPSSLGAPQRRARRV